MPSQFPTYLPDIKHQIHPAVSNRSAMRMYNMRRLLWIGSWSISQNVTTYWCAGSDGFPGVKDQRGRVKPWEMCDMLYMYCILYTYTYMAKTSISIYIYIYISRGKLSYYFDNIYNIYIYAIMCMSNLCMYLSMQKDWCNWVLTLVSWLIDEKNHTDHRICL